MKKWVFALIVGIVLLSFGARNNVGSDTITCGGKTMYPGDVCEQTRGGVTTDTKTYSEMKESAEAGARTFNSWGRWALLGAGGVFAIGGIIGIVVVRRRRAAAPAQPQAAQPQVVPSQNIPLQNMPPQFAPPQQMPHAPYPPAPYPQQMPQQPHPPQGWGPSGPQN